MVLGRDHLGRRALRDALLLPAIIAYQRRHPQKQAIFALNILLGWTFLGWTAAMVWAFVDPAPGRQGG